jgi:hypothetical protein
MKDRAKLLHIELGLPKAIADELADANMLRKHVYIASNERIALFIFFHGQFDSESANSLPLKIFLRVPTTAPPTARRHRTPCNHRHIDIQYA